MAKIVRKVYEHRLDVFQIMPNHMHGIISIIDDVANVGAGFTSAQNSDRNNKTIALINPDPTGSKTIGEMMTAYKSIVANDCLKIFK